MMMGRRLTSLMDNIKPSAIKTSNNKKTLQKQNHDKNCATLTDYKADDKVWVRDTIKKEWKEGVIMKQNGPLSYVVQTTGGEKRMHADQLRKRTIGKRDQEDSKQNINEEVGGDLTRGENENESDQIVERGNTRQESEQRSSTESSEAERNMSDEEFRLPDDQSERNEDESEARKEVNEGLGLRRSTRIRRKHRYLQGEE
ncbi:hypothetical protein ACOME3_006769, partial [Neoechinorhynchus agilis]